MELLVFFIGILVGLFINYCIYRIFRKQNIITKFLPCSNCKVNFKLYNIGISGYCSGKIDYIYLVVILLSGILFMLLFDKFEFNIDFFIYGFLISLLIIVAFIDMKLQIIPDIIVLIIFIGAVAHEIWKLIKYKSFVDILDNILGLFTAGILFILVFVFSKGGIGGGDVKLISVLGFILGIPKIFLCIFLSFLLGAIVSIFLLAFGIKEKKDSIPFGPFIVISFIITFFWGEEIMYWYITTMFML
jgi:leader peptidase (prepilin peptidase)/N-methyltransferase